MDKKITAAIVAIVVVVVVVVAAYYVMQGDDDDDDTVPFDASVTMLVVYGNANNDNYLDDEDIQFIRSIVNGETEWDSESYPFADANCDGEITQEDIDLVEQFLNGEECIMYYLTQDLTVDYVHYPLEGTIAGFYDSTLAICQIVGIYDDVTHMARAQSYIDNLSTELYPGADELIPLGGYPYEYESVVASGCSILLGDKFIFTDEFVQRIKESTDIDCILLPENRVINGMNWSTSVVTLGVMTNNQSNTAAYIEYVTEVESLIETNLADIDASEKTFLIVYDPDPSQPNNLEVTIHGTGVTQFGDIMNIETLPLTCVMDPVGESGDVTGVEMEDVLTMDPDIIFISTWELYMPDITEEEYMAIIEEKAEMFSETRAYREGNIFVVPYEVYGTLPGISGLTYLASLIWPDDVSEEEGIAYIQRWYDEFTPVDIDVTQVVGILPIRLGVTS